MSLLASLLIYFVKPIITLFIMTVLISVIMSWLVAFNVINLRNPVARQIYEMCEVLTRPILNPIRRFLPGIGGLDLSPVIALLFLSWVNNFLIAELVDAVSP
ncbi:MAG: YggT family protein [Hyphomonadaceae bacterium]|nr:YggT family protein [Hyphomonadaceae bacterium]